jgi:hypothetical protein
MKNIRGVTALFLVLVLTSVAVSQDKAPLTSEVVVNILQKAFPDLKADQVRIAYIKHLASRVKVNLTIEGRNAVLYLTWQKNRAGANWWFERDPDRSLVYFSSTTGTARAEESTRGAREARKAEAAKARVEQKGEIEIKAEAETEKAESKLEEPQEVREEPPVEAERPTTEVEKPIAEEQREPEAVSEEKTAAVEDVETKAEALETAEPEESEPAHVPLEVAVGPEATPRQFITALVKSLTLGDEEHYTDFVLRMEEFSIRVDKDNYDSVMQIWRDQCRQINMILGGFKNVAIKKITLDRQPNADETLRNLRKMVPGTNEVYNAVKIDLILDGKRYYMTVGGLLRVDGGWRVGGRIEILESQVFDLQ